MFLLPSPSSDLKVPIMLLALGMAILMNTPASFSGSRDRDLLKGKEEGEGRELWLGIFVVCKFSYLEIVDILFIVKDSKLKMKHVCIQCMYDGKGKMLSHHSLLAIAISTFLASLCT